MYVPRQRLNNRQKKNPLSGLVCVSADGSWVKEFYCVCVTMELVSCVHSPILIIIIIIFIYPQPNITIFHDQTGTVYTAINVAILTKVCGLAPQFFSTRQRPCDLMQYAYYAIWQMQNEEDRIAGYDLRVMFYSRGPISLDP